MTILPSLGKYSRSNNVSLSSQTVREALNDTRTYATSPDPNTCPTLPNKTLSWVINAYAFYVNPGVAVPLNSYTPNPTYDATYACGQFTDAVVPTLANNQYAILALHLSPNISAPTYASVMGIVSVGYLDNPAIFRNANKDNSSALANPILFIYSSPSGSFLAPSAILGLDTTCVTSCNTFTKKDDVITFGYSNYKVDITADGLYGVASVGYDNTFRANLLVNLFTGQTSSTNKPPAGIIKQ